jgi:dTDP-4-dehydrorhamnose 3,5-epimerase
MRDRQEDETDYYAQSDERGIIWNYPALAIPWPVATHILSAKDRIYKSLAEMESQLPQYRPVG